MSRSQAIVLWCAMLWALAACDGAAPATAITAESATPSVTASSAQAEPPRDDTPPLWTAPGYTEISWAEAEKRILLYDVDRVIGTRTRRVYLITRGDDVYKRFTIEPRSGALKSLLQGMPRYIFLRSVDNHEVPWKEAEAILREGRARSVFASHFDLVYITDKEGREYLSIPGPDAPDLVKLAGPVSVTIE